MDATRERRIDGIRARSCTWAALCLLVVDGASLGSGGLSAAPGVASTPPVTGTRLGQPPASGTVATEPSTDAPGYEGPIYAVPTTLDHVGRVLAPVTVNGQGPFRFIIDTGANRSVLSLGLQQRLGLEFDGQATIGVHGVTGSAVLPAVRLALLQAGDLVLARNQLVPVLPQAVLADADGILGVEGLDKARIDIDFVADRVSIAQSNGRLRAPDGFLTIPASIRHGGLLMIQAKVGRVRTKAIIDTGAERTLGNGALRDALLYSRKSTSAELITTVLGATPDIGQGTSLVAPTIFLGDAELRNLQVTFGDLHVFTVWGLDREPALLIGMDLLGAVDRLIIDYRRREVQVKPRT